MKGKSYFFFLSFLSAILLSLSWYWHLSICAFFAFVPLLVIEDEISSSLSFRKPKLSLLAYSYLSFFSWNILVTWWVVYASFGGACMAFVFNSLFMALVFVLFSSLKNKFGRPSSIWLLIPLWIAWEHVHTLWDLAWTWLTLGNTFAFNHNWVQWFEFTGTSGGTFWILAVNILAFKIIKHNRSLKLISGPVLKLAAAIILPVLFSYAILLYRVSQLTNEKREVLKVVVVQPNIDPYNEKFYLDYQSQFIKALRLARPKITEHTDYLVLPETFITDDINESQLDHDASIQWFRDSLIAKFPKLRIITGGNTYVFYEPGKTSATARLDEQSGKYYDVYNSGIYIDRTCVQVYHKSKLVPGVERMPFPALFKPLENFAIDMGGTTGSLGTQEERTVFHDSISNISIAPVICYESVYADYVSAYIRNGANFIFIITNDGWWEDTPGYKQHLNYARLRAIETRRDIARSANTGISCFINSLGEISETTTWWKEAVIQKDLRVNSKLTFFSKFGDLLSYASVLLSGMLIVTYFFLRFKTKKE
jgi:apolipoprotein N-acyltransferase